MELVLNEYEFKEYIEVDEVASDNGESIENLTFIEALEILGIKEFEKEIFNCDSMGELFHIPDYIHLANILSENEKDRAMFKKWFHANLKYCKSKDNRVYLLKNIESVFISYLKV